MKWARSDAASAKLMTEATATETQSHVEVCIASCGISISRIQKGRRQIQDPLRESLLWTAEELAGHDGSADSRLAHTSVMGYVVLIHPGCRAFGAWKGNDITRRWLLHFNGASSIFDKYFV